MKEPCDGNKIFYSFLFISIESAIFASAKQEERFLVRRKFCFALRISAEMAQLVEQFIRNE